MKKKNLKHVSEGKVKAVKEISDLIKTKKTVLIADISSIPGSQFQQIGKKLRGKALVKVPKKNLFFRAIDESKKEGVEKLKEFFDKPVAILFSDLDSYELAGYLLKNKSPSKAKPGQIATKDLEIPAGPTDLVPGPAISELGALGIQIQIQGGKIEIKSPKIITKEGEKITEGASAILSKLGIMPFTIGFTPICAYDSLKNILYVDIKINTDEATESLKNSYARGLALAVKLGYFTQETTPLMIQKAASHERRLIKVITGEPDEAPVLEEKKETPQEKKEEKKVNAAEGLASLFG
ncbi:MAG: 50S ribosomal protein L10 [archaeon]|nr:50S ribosomal protein L10 [archaeon]